MAWTTGVTTGATMASEFNALESAFATLDGDFDTFLAGFDASVDARIALGVLNVFADVQITSPANNDVLTYETATGLWKNKPPSGGGGGSPGGATGEVQYNNAGVFAGAADFEVETGQLRLPSIALPAAPAASGVKLFGKDMAGLPWPQFLTPGFPEELPVQPMLGDCHIMLLTINGGLSWEGGFRGMMIGGPATGVAANASHRFFLGLHDTGAPTDVNPSTLFRMVGIGYDSADTQLQFMHNDGTGAATKIALGASFPKPTADLTDLYRLRLWAPPGTTRQLNYEVLNIVTRAVATGQVTTDLPAVTDLLSAKAYTSVGGVSAVTGVAVGDCAFQLDMN